MPKKIYRNISIFHWLIVCAIILVIALYPSFFNRLKYIAVQTLTFPVRVISKTGNYFVSKRSLCDKNALLLKQVSDAGIEMSKMQEIEKENERLRSLLELKKKFKYATISAEVIARGPNDWTGTFIVNRGYLDGLSKQAAVCSSKGLLGKIVYVDKKISYVELLTHPSFRSGGVVSETRVNGVVAGAGKGLAKMLYIPMDADVDKGDVVVTSGLSRIFPEGIRIGEIINIKKSESGLYKYALIKPYANFYNEEEVLCVLEK